MATKRKKRGPGRPKGTGDGLSEASVLVTGPALLLGAVEAMAEREGITTREWWRRAARQRLGWREVAEASGED